MQFGRQSVSIFLPSSFNVCFGAQKNRLTAYVLLRNTISFLESR